MKKDGSKKGEKVWDTMNNAERYGPLGTGKGTTMKMELENESVSSGSSTTTESNRTSIETDTVLAFKWLCARRPQVTTCAPLPVNAFK